MKISNYIISLLKDLFAASGFLTVIAVIFLKFYSRETISVTLLWQILLAASAYTFFKAAFANKYDLDEKARMYSYFIFSLLGDTVVLILLCFFSPGRVSDFNTFIAFFIAILVMKAMVYPMMYINSHAQAKELNEKLSAYKNHRNE